MLNYPVSITIDTNIFDAAKYDLSDNSTLCMLAKFVREGKVKVYLSDIVLEEAREHVKEKGKELYSTIRKNRTVLKGIVDEETIKDVGLQSYLTVPSMASIVDSIVHRFDQYILSLKPILFDRAKINLDEIIRDYFEFNAPFEHSEKKRKEFPDAFIACQIRNTFPTGNLIIISNDEGFRKACEKDRSFTFYNSLGNLYNTISEHDINYNKAVQAMISLKDMINMTIKEIIERDEDIIVAGLSYDRKGVVSGYDYTETYLSSLNEVKHGLFSVDDVNNDEAVLTLRCSADIEMDCYYKDYDNAAWDGELKEYVFIDTVNVIEKHKAHFAVRLFLNMSEMEFEIDRVSIRLGDDTRVERTVVGKTTKSVDYYTECPECGCKISAYNDGGNGFCINCAPGH